MNISSARFDRSAPDLDSCPGEALPEFAFIGRSNVGKSSLLNMLAGQSGLARVSPTPGFTKLINIFTINKTWRLVDLPGYGFAQVARKDSASFNEAVLDYLQHRKHLRCVFALIDSSLPLQAIDVEFLEWLTSHQRPYVLVFTKTDTVSPEQVRANIAALTDRISGWFEKLPEILSCSATTRQGRRALLDVIARSLAEAGQEPVEPPPSSSAVAPPPEDTPAPGWPVRATYRREGRPTRARPW